ncbi:hypothetical protein ACN28E_54765 [Archangium lansingense]|uniref:hypothetical protein n=1 Tax=Archangium lansingense TaxID=2995310 RepID=UPI003B816D3B
MAPLVDTEGLRVFAKDMTARKRMEAKLFKADRMAQLGSLAASVGHEMGTGRGWRRTSDRCLRWRETRRGWANPS